MKRSFRKGQSILEYTLLLGAVIGVIVFALLNSGGIKDKVQGTYTNAGDALESVNDNMTTGIFGMGGG